MALECNVNEDCFGRADTCTYGVCNCGSTARCLGVDICVFGQCVGMEKSFSISILLKK